MSLLTTAGWSVSGLLEKRSWEDRYAARFEGHLLVEKSGPWDIWMIRFLRSVSGDHGWG
jgi:hypothetical protein